MFEISHWLVPNVDDAVMPGRVRVCKILFFKLRAIRFMVLRWVLLKAALGLFSAFVPLSMCTLTCHLTWPPWFQNDQTNMSQHQVNEWRLLHGSGWEACKGQLRDWEAIGILEISSASWYPSGEDE